MAWLSGLCDGQGCPQTVGSAQSEKRVPKSDLSIFYSAFWASLPPNFWWWALPKVVSHCCGHQCPFSLPHLPPSTLWPRSPRPWQVVSGPTARSPLWLSASGRGSSDAGIFSRSVGPARTPVLGSGGFLWWDGTHGPEDSGPGRHLAPARVRAQPPKPSPMPWKIRATALPENCWSGHEDRR